MVKWFKLVWQSFFFFLAAKSISFKTVFYFLLLWKPFFFFFHFLCLIQSVLKSNQFFFSNRQMSKAVKCFFKQICPCNLYNISIFGYAIFILWQNPKVKNAHLNNMYILLPILLICCLCSINRNFNKINESWLSYICPVPKRIEFYSEFSNFPSKMLK